MAAASSPIARGYDALAAGYDDQLARDRWMRRLLWRRFDSLFRAGDRVLDVGCGTGIDAVHLAENGVRVTAIDVSPEMVGVLRAKVAERRISPAPEILVGDINASLETLSGPFDGLVSSFAALNTVALDRFAAAAAGVLRPGAHLVCHMLAPGYRGRRLAHLWSSVTARRRAERGGLIVQVGEQAIEHAVLPPDEVYERFFARFFVLADCQAVGLVVSTALERRLPLPVQEALNIVERGLSRVPALRGLGRFFVLHLVRRL